MSKKRTIILFVLAMVVLSWLFVQSWRSRSRDEAIRKDFRTISLALDMRRNENFDVYPRDLSFFSEYVTYTNAGRLNTVDLSRVKYVWLGSKRYSFSCNWGDAPPAEYYETLRKLYGEFEYWGTDGKVERTFGVDPIEGLPVREIIQFLYDDDFIGDNMTYVGDLNGILRILPREQAHEMIALQNAFLRLPVDESDTKFLLKGLNHSNSGFRFRSAEALAKLGRPEGREFLDSKFESDDIYLKARAADALARVGEPAAIDFLQATAGESNDKHIRVFAEVTLREIREWRPTEMQYYTDDEWKYSEQWAGTHLPYIREDFDKANPQLVDGKWKE